MKVHRFKGLGKYLTLTYWKVRWALMPSAKILEVVHFDIDNTPSEEPREPLYYWRPGMAEPVEQDVWLGDHDRRDSQTGRHTY